MKMDKKLRGLGWAGFMVKPIQRLPRYELLLNDCFKHTEEGHPLRGVLSSVKEMIVKSIRENNEKMKGYIEMSKLRGI